MATLKPLETYRLVEVVFGSDQEALTQSSYRSVIDRLTFCSYHYSEVSRPFASFEKKLTGKPSIIIAIADAKVRQAFDTFLVKAGAHTVAAIQCAHAVPDILAHAVYFGTAQDQRQPPLAERMINLHAVAKRLESDTRFSSLAPLLLDLVQGADWEYLANVSNLCKHRSVLRSELNEDWSGTRADFRQLQLQKFSRNGTDYPAKTLSESLEPEYKRIATAVEAIFTELNARLRKLQI